MSLYTISSSDILPVIKQPAGLSIKKSTDAVLLAALGDTTVENVQQRMQDGHIAFVAFIHHQPAAFGWMATNKATIGELNHLFILPENNRYLWNFRTLAAYRGLGIYPALLQHIIRYDIAVANRFWIIHAPENGASLKGIIKTGFQYVGKLYTGNNGVTSLDPAMLAKNYTHLLKQMHFHISTQTSASCWNCSSPYLKKRKMECCCSENNAVCTDNSMLSLAY